MNKKQPTATLAELPNLGPKSAQWLQAVGIEDAAQLRAMGAVAAFVRVRRSGVAASLNLLWALEGAICEQPWQTVARSERTRLLMALEDHERNALHPAAGR
ncbi:TfoX/Sxy family protein [Roseateles sp.]|uniref:TfoX/Sxy family protein n=1 Tax=Roseateles sp. TaxID=1971397 RepID=UPI003919A014